MAIQRIVLITILFVTAPAYSDSEGILDELLQFVDGDRPSSVETEIQMAAAIGMDEPTVKPQREPVVEEIQPEPTILSDELPIPPATKLPEISGSGVSKMAIAIGAGIAVTLGAIAGGGGSSTTQH